MRRTLTALSFASALLLACKGEAQEVDVSKLYRVEASASSVKAGETGTFHVAIRPNGEAHVKPETPFRGKISATGPITVSKTQIAYADHVKVENQGPVFEIPFQATGPGSGEIKADLTFFVCTAELCQRTTNQVSVPVQVQ